MSEEIVIFKNGNFELSSNGDVFFYSFKNRDLCDHIIFQNFIKKSFLRKIEANFPSNIRHQKRATEFKKGSIERPEFSDQSTIEFYDFLNSPKFLKFLEGMTGLNGLIPDPYGWGGGLHETLHEGKLNLHKDFNFHDHLKLKRVLNVLVYLNSEWEESWNGKLEFWSGKPLKKQVSINPYIGTCVVFRTDQNSYHGFPEKLNCGVENSRKSIALYYYISPTDKIDEMKMTTNFTARPNSSDETEIFMKIKYLIKDFIPPILSRIISKIINSKKN